MSQNEKHLKGERISEATLLVITIIWGSSFMVTHFAFAAGLSPLFILMCRFSIAAVFMGIFYFRRIIKALRVAHIKYGLLLGSIFFLAFYTSLVGLKYSSPSNNAIITCTNVVIVPIIWWLKTRIRPRSSVFFSCAISLVGLLVISLDFSQGFTLHMGDIFSFLSAILFAAQIVSIGEMSQHIDHCELVFMEFLTAAFLSVAFYLLTERGAHYFTDLSSVLSVLYLGIVCTCICFLLQAWAMRSVNSTRGAVIMSTEALFGSIISILAGSDVLSWRIVIGGLLITSAVILPELKPKQNSSAVSRING